MDMDDSSLGTRGRALRTAASTWPPQHASDFCPESLGTLPAYDGLIRAERLT
ncbi:MAG TPA: hypothetical protein VKU77_07780 [Streptosporangiaceae bacterium]|jgi:hypothetical protein|nr:hypothetical protein [Streptosporangiaceae bacterium]